MSLKLIRPVEITDAVLTASNVAESETAWSAATTYSMGQTCYEVVAGVHQKFTSKQNTNLNHQPSLDTTATWWQANGPTNRWAMFDGAYQTQTTRADEVAVTLALPSDERMNVLWIGNLAGVEASVTITDATEGVIHDETYSLVSVSGINDEYDWAFEPIERVRELTLEDLPGGYTGVTVDVSVTAAGETAAVGALVVGFAKVLGDTRWGGSISIRDYSVKEEDAFGNLVVVERAYRKTATLSAILRNDAMANVVNNLTDYRARPALWIGSASYAPFVIWGFVKDWNVEASLPPSRSLLSMNLEGLT
ncbi:hypothetical protein [Phenylobacterium sp.]|uniref:hypothetical protein n=1 Tax=Phenylobacterium sp. TaxID=1871053 RepID=UPI00391C22A5